MKRPRIDHVGIIVENLEQSVKMFAEQFNLIPSEIKELADVGIKVAHLEAENICIELIQYINSQKGFAEEVMGRKAGYNHISIEVENVESALHQLKKHGVRTLAGFPREGSHGTVAFFKPETTQDLLLEISEK